MRLPSDKNEAQRKIIEALVAVNALQYEEFSKDISRARKNILDSFDGDLESHLGLKYVLRKSDIPQRTKDFADAWFIGLRQEIEAEFSWLQKCLLDRVGGS